MTNYAFNMIDLIVHDWFDLLWLAMISCFYCSFFLDMKDTHSYHHKNVDL